MMADHGWNRSSSSKLNFKIRYKPFLGFAFSMRYRRPKYLTCTSLFIFLLLFSSSPAVQGRASHDIPWDESENAKTADLIKKRISEAGSPPKIRIGKEFIHDTVMLDRFYSRRGFRPAWAGANGSLAQAYALVKAIEDSRNEGLTPDYYHLKNIESLLAGIREGAAKDGPSFETMADLDLLLTDAFLLLSCHLSAGCVNPVTLDAEWHAGRETVDVSSILEKALEDDLIEETLIKLLPSQYGYSRLRQALAHDRKIAERGGWPAVSTGPSLKKESFDRRVIELKKRLIASGDLTPEEDESGELFDETLEQAVIRFQEQHGLDADGVAGPATLKAINVPVQARIRQIELNMERLRWIPRDLGQKYIIVNIADFKLDLFENGHTNMSMKVVVGKNYWHTPVFSAVMTYLELNPYWNVPKNIMVREIIPKMSKDPDYLAKNNLKVIWEGQGRIEVIDPGALDWSLASAKNFNYKLRQDPGPQNPLGRIKFMFPNRFNVYLHDTPVKNLFSKNVRAFSHGCIRIEKPMELAEYLLKRDPSWTQERIQAAIDDGRNKAVRLPQPIAVYILYLTAWVDEAGRLNFREDVYDRDIQMDKALGKRPPAP